ncbi:hypothetical protein [Vibrio tubiashii]|uniref:hypothetical protein n=1 Tax=Vibrio tubiashii TaxID=29498 RepID=UPI00349EC084
MPLYCVTNWRDYSLITAKSPMAAIQSLYGRHYQRLDNQTLTQDCVVHVMCCEYHGYVESNLERMHRDIDRVLWLDMYQNTLRFQSTCKSLPTH